MQLLKNFFYPTFHAAVKMFFYDFFAGILMAKNYYFVTNVDFH